MSRIYSDSIEINQICSDVNSGLTDLTLRRHWCADLVNAETVGVEQFGQGTKWIDVRKIEGAEIAHMVEVTDYVENESLSLIISTGGADEGDGADPDKARKGVAFLEYRIVDYDTTTTVHLDIKLELPGLFDRLFKKPRTAAYLDLCRKDLQRLKKYLETPSPSGKE